MGRILVLAQEVPDQLAIDGGPRVTAFPGAARYLKQWGNMHIGVGTIRLRMIGINT
jgi:hypothetical protein